ncbi:MAG: hypothetical protein WCO86_16520, partial [Planctomycetota bacterium]
PQVAARRDRQFAEGGPQEIVNLSPPLGPGLHHGLGASGILTDQPQLSDGRWLDAVLQNQFAFLSASPAAANELLPSEHSRLKALGVQWQIDPAFEPWLEKLGAKVLLLRPDRYVFGGANTSKELSCLIAKMQIFTLVSPVAPT